MLFSFVAFVSAFPAFVGGVDVRVSHKIAITHKHSKKKLKHYTSKSRIPTHVLEPKHSESDY
jgi:hypothetical protein